MSTTRRTLVMAAPLAGQTPFRQPARSELVIRRKVLWTLLTAAAPHARGQSKRSRPLIAFLGGVSPDPATQRTMIDPFEQGLRALGWAPGQELDIEYRWAGGQPERLPALLAELLKLEPTLLVAAGPRPLIVARDAGVALPVLALHVDDPVTLGVAISYQRPGGRFTGISGPGGVLPRRLQLLKDMLPGARALGILANPLTHGVDALLREVPEWERKLDIALHVQNASAADQFDAAFATLVRQKIAGLAILADATFWTHRAALGALCTKHRLPAVMGGAGYLDSVGVASYQADIAEMFRRGASFVDKILKGTPPGAIPWEQATRFELVVNAKAARAIGLRLPQSLLVSADGVIE